MESSKNPDKKSIEEVERTLIVNNEYLEKITKVVPFEIQTTKIRNDGWANFVVEINDEWIFRFSRGELTRTQMEVERAFLPEFSKVSSVKIPHIEFSGEGYMGYKKIDGTPFKAEVLQSLSEEGRTQAARELGVFLTELHGYQFAHENLVEFPYGGGNFWEEVWPTVSTLLSEVTRAKAHRYFEEYFKNVDNSSRTKTITHSDLGTSNVLFDSVQQRLAGVIDFGDMCLHDPARDFNGILRNHGRVFTEQVLGFYDRKVESNFWDRINFYARKQDFQVIYYAPKFGFQDLVPSRVASIEDVFRTMP